jgi:hypothetical protein
MVSAVDSQVHTAQTLADARVREKEEKIDRLRESNNSRSSSVQIWTDQGNKRLQYKEQTKL